MRHSLKVCLAIATCATVAIVTACAPGRSAAGHASNSTGNQPPDAAPTAAIAAGPPPADVVSAVDDFGFDLLRHISGADGPNIVVSPYSVSAILSLTASGAGGGTATEMHRVLRDDAIAPGDLKTQWSQLNAGIAKRSPDQILDVANAMWANRGLTLKTAFVAYGRSTYHAQLTTLDFSTQDMTSIVNKWVASKTRGVIPMIVQKVDPQTVLMLANAVYFKGAWQVPFRVGGTQNMDFALPDGSKVQVPMMSRWDDSIQSTETSSFIMVRLPYKGADSAMYVLLPSEKVGLAGVERTLTGSEFLATARSVAKTAPKNTLLGFPRLDLAWGQDNLKNTLAAMGMPAAFDSSAADFGGISNQKPLYITQVAHKTRIKVGELGTEAAAATYVGMAGGVPPVVIFDRPFLFGIVDEKSGAILFLGAVTDPRAK